MFGFLLALVLTASPTFANGKVIGKSVIVASGQMKQIAVFGDVTPACTNGKVTIRLTDKPLNGTLSSKLGTIPAGALKRCPDLMVKAAAVFYKSNPGFEGKDRAVIEIVTEKGQSERHEFVITVQ
jgi:hypothetical protein